MPSIVGKVPKSGLFADTAGFAIWPLPSVQNFVPSTKSVGKYCACETRAPRADAAAPSSWFWAS